MNKFTKGILAGIGIGFLFAPLKGEDLRHVLAERARELRDSLPESSRARLNQYTHEISDRVAYARENWRDYAQQAASKMKDTGTTLGNKAMHVSQDLAGNMADRAMQTGQDVAGKAAQTGQDVADKAKHASQDLAGKAKHTSQDLAHKAKHAGQDLAHKAMQTTGLRNSDGGSTKVIPEQDLDY